MTAWGYMIEALRLKVKRSVTLRKKLGDPSLCFALALAHVDGMSHTTQCARLRPLSACCILRRRWSRTTRIGIYDQAGLVLVDVNKCSYKSGIYKLANRSLETCDSVV